MARRILFYGDSNTWGYITGGERYPSSVRFPTLATSSLPGTTAVEAGLNGRNAAFSHPLCTPDLLGGATFASVFTDALPVDILCLMLGTNDLLPPLCRSAADIAADLEHMIHIARELSRDTRILLLSPVPIHSAWLEELETEMGACQALRPDPLAPALADLAAREKVDFLDTAEIVPMADGGDGVHLSEDAHRRLATAIRKRLAELLAGQ